MSMSDAAAANSAAAVGSDQQTEPSQELEPSEPPIEHVLSLGSACYAADFMKRHRLRRFAGACTCPLTSTCTPWVALISQPRP